MNEDDFGFLDNNSAVQGDDINYNPEAEPSQWTADYGGYDWNLPETQMQNQNGFNFEDNISNSPLQGWQQNGTDWGMVDQTTGSNFSNPMIDAYNRMPSMNQASTTLANLFNNKGFTTGLSALLSGYTNKKKAAALQNLASQLKQTSDPFGSQRPFYQQQLQQAVQDPYSQPMVRNQVDALQQAQAIKDAAAGRRSNSMTSAPALLAAQAQVAQNYMNSLQNPAGAGIAPNMSNYMQAQTGAINAGANGFLSPLASAVGYNQQNGINADSLAAALQKLSGG